MNEKRLLMDTAYKAIYKMKQSLVASLDQIIGSYNFDWADRIVKSYNFDTLTAIQSTIDSIQERYNSLLQIPEFYQSLQEVINRMGDMYSAKIEESISLALEQSSFSSLADNLTFQGDFVELSEKAVEILSPYGDLPIIEEPCTDFQSDNHAPIKHKMHRMDLINLLIGILAIILPMIQAQINETINSAEQKQQWEIENEYHEELIAQNDAIIALLEQLAAAQESAAEDHISVSPDQESAACTQPSVADDQTVPDESDAPDTDEQ